VSAYFTCRPGVDHVDMSTHVGPMHAATWPARITRRACGRAHVGNVDHAKNNCPHGPHACAGVFWRGRSVDNVGTLDHGFKSVAYNTVYSYCIHFYNFHIFIYTLSTLSTKPLFHWRATWTIYSPHAVRIFAHMVHKNPIRESPSKIILDNANKSLTI